MVAVLETPVMQTAAAAELSPVEQARQIYQTYATPPWEAANRGRLFLANRQTGEGWVFVDEDALTQFLEDHANPSYFLLRVGFPAVHTLPIVL